MSREENVINFYIICNRLKNTIRTGWIDWNVKRDRLESVAEHIYSTQMLAIHELGETIIGDLTLFQISKEEKEQIEHEAVFKILDGLVDKEYIKELFLEFDSQKTKESIFAYQCDKLECDLQSKLYDIEGCIDLNNQKGNTTMNNPTVKKLLDNGDSFSDMWLKFGQKKYPYDDNFRSVSSYMIGNKLENNSLILKKKQ